MNRAELLAVVSGAPTFKHLGNGDELCIYTAVYAVRDWAGTPTPDGEESEELRFFLPDALPLLAGPVSRRVAELLRGSPPRS